jgi:hypothetical protein
MPSKCDLWFYRHEKHLSQTPVCHLSVAKKRFVLIVFFSVLMVYESTFTRAINLWPPIVWCTSQCVPMLWKRKVLYSHETSSHYWRRFRWRFFDLCRFEGAGLLPELNSLLYPNMNQTNSDRKSSRLVIPKPGQDVKWMTLLFYPTKLSKGFPGTVALNCCKGSLKAPFERMMLQ